jgi:hypothetical protein
MKSSRRRRDVGGKNEGGKEQNGVSAVGGKGASDPECSDREDPLHYGGLEQCLRPSSQR